MRKTILWTLAILAAAASARGEQPVNVTRLVAAGVSISIENIAGSLIVVGSDGTEVKITGTLGDDVEELEISGDADELSIEVVIPDDEWKGARKVKADLELTVPRGATLEIEVVSASVDISGVNGAIEGESVSGNFTVTGGLDDIDIESVSGSVSVSGGSGSISAESVSGLVTLNGVSGDVEAATVSGAIRVDAGAVDDVELESIAGSIYFKGHLGSGSLEIETHSGNVEILLPAGVSAEFELESFSGRIENGFGPPAKRVDRYVPGSSTEFRTGMGDAEVSVETFSGSIVLKSF